MSSVSWWRAMGRGCLFLRAEGPHELIHRVSRDHPIRYLSCNWRTDSVKPRIAIDAAQHGITDFIEMLGEFGRCLHPYQPERA